jgi:hypothetical protein
MDPEIVSYKTLGTGDALVKIDASDAWARSYIGSSNELLVNAGLDTKLFQPGVAHTFDLTPGVQTFYSRKISPEDLRLTVSPAKFNNNFVIFSGQK